jgi:DNA repair photolyase
VDRGRTETAGGRPDQPVGRLRWAGQRVDALEAGALPGLDRVAGLVRSVRTPDFEGVTFHEVLAKSALNHVAPTSAMLPGEWTLNPYRGCTHACAYCYARPTHDHLGLDIGRGFDTQVVVKTNVVEVLRAELATKRSLPDRVALGTNTDPYQRAEGRYQLMPGIIDALADARVPFSVLTKGSLIRRDLDRLVRAASRVRVELGLSISILDESLQSSLEPGTPSTAARLATLRELRAAGLECTVFLAPILPFLTDDDFQVDAVVGALAAAGATEVLPTVLYLRGGVKPLFLSWLRRERPELLDRYRDLYASGSTAPAAYREAVRGRVHSALSRHGLPLPTARTRDRFALDGHRGRAQPPAAPTLF